MKKIFLNTGIIAALISVAACSTKEPVEAVVENAVYTNLTVEASLPVGASGEGIKTAFVAKDFLSIRFEDAQGKIVGNLQQLRNKEAGVKGTFYAENIAIPNSAVKMYAYLDNKEETAVNFRGYPSWCHLDTQAGTLASAVSRQVVVGSVDCAAISGGKASVNLAYQTGIAKIVAKFPEDAVFEKDGKALGATIAIVSDDQINDAQFEFSSPTAISKKGEILVTAVVDKAARTATAYFAVWPTAGVYENANIVAKLGTVTYGEVLPVNLKAGQSAVVNQDVVIKEFNYWIPDETKVVEGVSGSVVSADSWITLADKKITVDANETGRVRTGKIVLNTGSTYVFTQIGPNDFKGTYEMTSKRFSNNTSVTPAGNPVGNDLLAFGEPILGETLEDVDGTTYTNQIGVRGLYKDAVADATVAIDYENRTVKFGLFLDARNNAQPVNNGLADYPYVCFLPEMAKGPGCVSPWNFIQVDLDTEKDYTWLWFEVSEDLTTFSYDCAAKPQYMLGNKKTANNCIIGITCAVSKSQNVDAANVKGANTNAGYDVIYQANPNNKTNEFVIVRK